MLAARVLLATPHGRRQNEDHPQNGMQGSSATMN